MRKFHNRETPTDMGGEENPNIVYDTSGPYTTQMQNRYT